jgi:transcriptional regulator GlxA family with amidase domain
VPPGHYRQERRLEKALSLLLNSQLTIGETAAAAGFDNIYYFSRVFKQYYMLSPQKYRQQAMDGKD